MTTPDKDPHDLADLEARLAALRVDYDVEVEKAEPGVGDWGEKKVKELA